MKTIAFSVGEYEEPLLRQFNHHKHDLHLTDVSLSADTADQAAGYEAALIFGTDDASAPVLEKLHALGVRYVVTRSAGTDHVDLPAAERLGIQVASIPRYSPHAIAEHAVMLILALGRQLKRSTDHVRAFNFELTNELVGFELHGKTAGIAGVGKIGAVVANILHGFGCRLLAYDLKPDPGAVGDFVQFVDLDTLLSQSDVLSLHLPLTPDTRGLFNKDVFAKMKPGALLVNTGRGAVVNTQDALDALETGQLGYLGMDVYEHEHGLFFHDHSDGTRHDPLLEALISRDDVLVTGHQAFLTHEALTAIARQSIEHLDKWAAGQ